LQLNNWVLLDRTYLTLDAYRQARHEKLLPVYVGPFQTTEIISPVSYRLRMPENSRAHDVFHISALKPYSTPDPSRQPCFPAPDVIDGHEE
jgi:hypothetical protein